MTIIFNPETPDDSKGFRIGQAQSLFQNNVTFQVTGTRIGNYELVKDDGSKSPTPYASKSQAILFQTSLGEDLPLKRLLNKRRVIYDRNGTARTVPSCDFQAPLREHMESLGRRANDPAFLNGKIEEVASHALKFFEGKTLICKEIEGLGKDDHNRLVPLLSPCIQFSFQE